jgi:hypothetical protein
MSVLKQISLFLGFPDAAKVDKFPRVLAEALTGLAA